MTRGLDVAVQAVAEFHKAFGHPVADKIAPLELGRGTSRAIWTGEELLVEFIHQSCDDEKQFLAAYDKMIEGLEKAKLKSLAMPYNKTPLEKVIGQMDALIDGYYFVSGSVAEIGVEAQPLFDIVQGANMAKLGPDGKPIIRPEDGKIMKPEGWEPPEAKLEAEIKRQIDNE